MKFLFFLLFIPAYFSAQTDYYSTVLEHRTNKNAEFNDTLNSPLKKHQIKKFDSLNYFVPNPKFKIQAKFVKEIGTAFDMTTSSGQLKKFRQYGKLLFTIDSTDFELPIYQNLKLMSHPLYRDYIFIPFTDLTNGDETYGGGRYIEAKTPTSDTFELDFNYSFNPYCHYTTGYNCPIPPKENFLNIRIEAGEKIYRGY